MFEALDSSREHSRSSFTSHLGHIHCLSLKSMYGFPQTGGIDPNILDFSLQGTPKRDGNSWQQP